jgi:hypothetical protein
MDSRPKRFYYNKNFYFSLILVIAAVILLLFLLNDVIMPDYTHHDEGVTVPNVTRLPLKDAEKMLKSSGLRYEVSERRPNNAFPANYVIDQDPRGSNIVKPHRKISLTVNTTSNPTVKMPKIENLSLRNAHIQLENAGLKMGTVSYESGRFKNTVLHQSIKPGKSIEKGTAVDMVVSNGMGKKSVTVPDIIGLELTKAVQKLRRRHLRIGQIQFDSTKNTTPNIILNYSPKVKRIAEGKSLNLVVSEPSGVKKQKESRSVLDSVLSSPPDSAEQYK